jgi:hypothetical protein
MKKILITLLFVVGLVSNAQAFTVKEEVQVVPPSQSYAEPSSSPSIGEVKSAMNKLLGESRKKIEDKLNQKDSATAKSIDAINASISTAKTDITAGQAASTKEVVTAVNDAKTDIIKGQDAVTTATSRNAMFLIIGIILIIAAVVVSVKRSTTAITSAVAANVADINARMAAVPSATAALVKELEPFTETFTIVDHEVTITAVPVDGGYSTLYVPKSFATEIANPADITTKKAHARGEFCADTISLLKKYLAGMFDGSDGYSKNQKKVIEHALGNGNLIIRKIV